MLGLVLKVLYRGDKGTQASFPTIKIMMMQLLNTCLYANPLIALKCLEEKEVSPGSNCLAYVLGMMWNAIEGNVLKKHGELIRVVYAFSSIINEADCVKRGGYMPPMVANSLKDLLARCVNIVEKVIDVKEKGKEEESDDEAEDDGKEDEEWEDETGREAAKNNKKALEGLIDEDESDDDEDWDFDEELEEDEVEMGKEEKDEIQ